MGIESNRFSRGEELANAISHCTGAVFGSFATVVMIIFSAKYGNAYHIISSAVFGVTMTLMYLSSTLNHWLPLGKGKEFFFTMDQITIYLLIAGTYTPFSLIAFHGTQGWIYFGIEWGIALTGILVKIFKPTKFEKSVNFFFIASYVIMGWLIAVDIPSIIENISLGGFIWTMAGGFFFTTGIIFFKLTKLRFHHLIWHLFVVFGSISHFIAIYFYVLPIKL